MRIKQIHLKEFKRFDDLTIDLGDNPKKIVAVVGPNGCGKSSIFDAFEQQLKKYRHNGDEEQSYYNKAAHYEDGTRRHSNYNRHQAVSIVAADNLKLTRTSFYIRTAYRFSPKLHIGQIGVMQPILETGDEPISSIAIDTRLGVNYKRLLGKSYSEFLAAIKLVRKSATS